MDQLIIIQSSFPKSFSFDEICNDLIKKKLAACIQITPNITSYYEWNNTIQKDNESLMNIKTKQLHFTEISNLINQHHPYEVPEIIMITIHDMSNNYLNWFNTQLKI